MLITSSLNYYSENKSLKERYEWVKKCISSDRYALETSIACIYPIEEYHISKEWKAFLAFVNKYIILELGTANSKTIGVRLRIAVNLLDKVDVLESWEKQMIHAALANNVYCEITSIELEDLPF